jgi:uncharacterized protein (TIGR01777 family)
VRILISGSTGMVGSALMDRLTQEGHELVRMVRPATRTRLSAGTLGSGSKHILWDPKAGTLDSGADGADAVIHLAGASIAGHRWTKTWKQELRDSRVAATRHLVSALRQLHLPPRVFIAASAIGFYGSRGDEELTESSSPGTDFLAQLTRDWEAESARAAEFGARVVTLRFGLILSSKGGALPLMALPFRLGIGGRVGSGRQWMSWITLEDVVGIIRYALNTNPFHGPANTVAPFSVRNSEFTAVLAGVLHRPAIFPAPAFALRLALGEMADALLLASQRVFPKRLEEIGYPFAHPQLEPAMVSVFSKSR